MPLGPDHTEIPYRARELVRRHYRSPWRSSTAHIADRLEVSPSALCHRYRDTFGTTIGRDVRRLRIALACQRLEEDPDRLLKQIAAEVGYREAAYRTFLNAFRAETGASPSQFVARVRARDAISRLRREDADGDLERVTIGRQSRISSA